MLYVFTALSRRVGVATAEVERERLLDTTQAVHQIIATVLQLIVMLLENANLVLKALNASLAILTVLCEVFFDLFELSLGLTQLFLS